MGHCRKELALGAVGSLRLPHRLLGEQGCAFGLFLRGDQHTLGVAPLEQRAELVAVVFQERSFLASGFCSSHDPCFALAFTRYA